MHIVVVLRQVPDLVEPLTVDAAGTALDWNALSYVLNECDDHALEQALLLKEAVGGSVTVVALDGADMDQTLYAAAAKGVDRILKIPRETEGPPSPTAAAGMYAAAIEPLNAELVLVGVQAHDELDGVLAPFLAAALHRPYVGVVRGAEQAGDGTVVVCKEFPGAVMAKMRVSLPAVIGVLAAAQPPRYVPVSRIRAAMKAASLEETPVVVPESDSHVRLLRLAPPAAATRAAMITGSTADVANRIVSILSEKGLLK